MAPMTNTIRAKLNKTISIVAMTKAITSYLLALYTRTTSVITLLGEPLCREHLECARTSPSKAPTFHPSWASGHRLGFREHLLHHWSNETSSERAYRKPHNAGGHGRSRHLRYLNR